jgi:hypothetical protein
MGSATGDGGAGSAAGGGVATAVRAGGLVQNHANAAQCAAAEITSAADSHRTSS